MPSKVFEYVVLYHPKAKTSKDGNGEVETKPSVMLVDVTRILAQDERQVAMLAARAIPEEYTSKLDQVEIAIRPF